MTSEILDRLPPCNLQAEQQALGSILLDPRILDDLGAMLTPDDWYSEAHGVIYGHLSGMARSGRGIDPTLLIDRLRQSGDLDRIGGMSYVAEIIQSVAVAAHWRAYASIVQRTARLRRIIQASVRTLQDAYEDTAKPDDVLAAAERSLQAIRSGSYESEPVTMAQACVDALEHVERVAVRRAGAGILTGLANFDAEIGGLFVGELAILAARPGQGKTSLAIQIAAHQAGKGRKVYFATLEMDAAQLALRRLCAESGVSLQAVRTGGIGPGERSQLIAAGNRVSVPNLYLHDWPAIRVFDIERAARRLKAEVVYVDYLQIVTPEDKKPQRYEQVGAISKGLKEMARRLKVPVVACCQLGRQMERDKSERRPRLSDLRESGNIEQDADVVLLLWRPADGVETKSGGKADAGLEAAKNRNGPTARLLLDWDGPTTTFRPHDSLHLPPSGAWTPDSWVPSDAEDF